MIKPDITKAIETAMWTPTDLNSEERQKWRPPKSLVEELAPQLKVIEKIRQKNLNAIENNLPLPIHDDLYSLLCSEQILTIAYTILAKNKGALTPGTQKLTADSMTLERIKNLANFLKNETFKWSTLRKIEIPRPGKKPRPLGLPDFDEKMVQYAIMIILQSIYEPILLHENVNKGFISHQSTHDNIKPIKLLQGLYTAIEGDIEGAFNNVNHQTLINILSRRIKDKRFLKLILDHCSTKTIMIDKSRKSPIISESPKGTAQGSICSPILFNIYMMEFDNYVKNDIQKYIDEINKTRNQDPKNKHHTKSFLSYKSKIDAAKKMLKKLHLIDKRRPLTFEEKEKIKYYHKRIQEMHKRRASSPSIDYSKTQLRIHYTRFADDWLIIGNFTEDIAQKIKEMVANYLQNTLNLTLSLEKTKITDLRKDKCTFLGFELYIAKRNPQKDVRTNSKSHTQRHFSTHIKIGIDWNRRLSELVKKSYATENYKPREVPYFIFLTPQEIVEKYNSIMMGLTNYYYPVMDYPSYLNRILYILYYSCLKTLAAKYKTTIRGIINKFGWEEINQKFKPTGKTRIVIQFQIENETKFVCLKNYMDIMDEAKWISIAIAQKALPPEYMITEDFWSLYKVNWRTQFKLSKCCAICGISYNICSHHIRHLKNRYSKKQRDFITQVMTALNRKSLDICRPCHDCIHRGLYDGMSLTDLYDIRLAKIENQLLAQPSKYYIERQTIIADIPKTIPLEFYPRTKVVRNQKEKINKLSK